MHIEAVLAWCILKKYIDNGRNPAVWRNNLSLLLPPKTKVCVVKHHEAPSVQELKKAVDYCRVRPCAGNACLLFVIATMGRVSECVKASAEEIVNDVWTVPQERMKTLQEVPYQVPMSSLAKLALSFCPSRGVLFKNKNSNAPIVPELPRQRLCEILGRPVTAHGIRSTFRDWAAREGIEDGVAEKCLAHRYGDNTVRAYYRDTLLDKRRVVLERWAKMLLG